MWKGRKVDMREESDFFLRMRKSLIGVGWDELNLVRRLFEWFIVLEELGEVFVDFDSW